MREITRWIDLEGAVNARDLGGLPTRDGGRTRFGRVFRADNLQGLTRADVRLLVADLNLRHVVDLRSTAEVLLEGPGPLARVPEVRHHHLTLFLEGGRRTDVDADVPEGVDGDRVLPGVGRVADDEVRVSGFYYGYLRDRPDAVVGALRAMALDDGAALVHCAAGKDRTGVLSALALEITGVTREAIVADYVATGERLEQILKRLRQSDAYRDDLDSRPADYHVPRAAYMERFLTILDTRFGGPMAWLTHHGWTPADTTAMKSRLRD
ncbi:Protein tyrosine/serine phosphatase [Nonomuraea maritima]|uniref:Protein tyrosine/serine phosphatase n=1 Tax=Nonomuraea maritima TaxID=683260 RepID=A0A1G9FDX0_9ACTN|nr:tyrosine-protein phosphatase [Nonomuraea maritima]SDK86569.1 Protein tyrosine/serine phosphatase [Nonomuraea maritima]